MDVAAIEKFNTEYRALLDAGKEDEAREYLLREFPQLPQDAQDKLLAEMVHIAMEDEVAEDDAITAMQETGLAAIEELDQIETSQETPPQRSVKYFLMRK